MNALELYESMKSELLARKAPLISERKQLEAAATRIAQIDASVLLIDMEIAEYDAAIAPLSKEAAAEKAFDASTQTGVATVDSTWRN